MRWRRRPGGALGAPQSPVRLGYSALVGITLGLGILFPLAGLSLVVVLLLDGAWHYLFKSEAEIG